PDDFTVSAFLMDTHGNLWLGGGSGLLRCNDEGCGALNFGDGVGTEYFVTALAEDLQGRIWVGGRGWLSVYDPAAEP
ncbi:MAG: transcriptional regulator, partial [Chloroflexi bacterium]|nr:transcriptional regulator [Chloroflexota bacterium]